MEVVQKSLKKESIKLSCACGLLKRVQLGSAGVKSGSDGANVYASCGEKEIEGELKRRSRKVSQEPNCNWRQRELRKLLGQGSCWCHARLVKLIQLLGRTSLKTRQSWPRLALLPARTRWNCCFWALTKFCNLVVNWLKWTVFNKFCHAKIPRCWFCLLIFPSPASWAPTIYPSTDLAAFLISYYFLNKKMQIQVWALFLGEVILAEVSCSYFFLRPAYQCDQNCS